MQQSHLMKRLAAVLLCIQPILSAIISEPQNTVYRNNVDLTGLVNCQISPVTDPVFWRVKDIIVYSTNQNLLPEKYTVSESASTTGNFSLAIKNLNRNDTGEYICQNEARHTTYNYITVADPPSTPVINVVAGELIEGRSITFRCTSERGYPAPSFVWTKSGEVLTSVDSPNDDGGISSSTLVVEVARLDNEQALDCHVVHILENKTTTHLLDVKYKPWISGINIAGAYNTVRRGEGFSISCDASSNPLHTSVNWTRDGVTVSSHTDLVLAQPSGITTNSTYQCVVTNSQGTGRRSLIVDVHYAPEVSIDQGEEITINEGQALTLTCNASAIPSDITYKWVKAGRNLDTVVTLSDDFVIPRVNRTHAGRYTCIATNFPLGEVESGNSSIQVNVEYKPSEPIVIIEPAAIDGVYRAGDMLTLTCSFPNEDKGFPVANYKWFRSGEEIGQEDIDLVISEATYNNSGKYSCLATNTVGSRQAQPLQVLIHDAPEFLSSSEGLVNLTKNQKSPQLLECVFRGLPMPQVLWYYNGHVIEDWAKYTVTNYTVFPSSQIYGVSTINSTLEFKGSGRNTVSISDMGLYSCRASSSIGTSQNYGNFTVNVHFLPEINSHDKVAADEGTEAVLSCEVGSYPIVSSLVISRGGQDVVSTADIIVSNIEQIDDDIIYVRKRSVTFLSVRSTSYGVYTCEAHNSLGSNQKNITLQRPSVPDVPTNLTIIDKSWDYLVVQWIPGFNGGRTQRFVVSVDGNNMQAVADSMYTIRGLLPDTEHDIRVTAKNSLGDSSKSGSTTATTDIFTVATPSIQFDSDTNILTVEINETGCCVQIMGSSDTTDDVMLFDGKCYAFENGRKQFTVPAPFYSHYKAKACIIGRENEVCTMSEKITRAVKPDATMWIVIGSVGGLLLVILIIAVVAVIITRRRKSGQTVKSISSPLNNGQINHVMINASEEVEMERPYSTYTPPANNNLNMGTFKNPLCARDSVDGLDNVQESQNLDYVYASVQKKSVDQNKRVNNYNSDQNQFRLPPPIDDGYELRRQQSSPPLESNSDNTDQDTLDEMPVFTHDHNLSLIIGSNPSQYQRFSNVSESGYSTPDSRAKRVIYEVIV